MAKPTARKKGADASPAATRADGAGTQGAGMRHSRVGVVSSIDAHSDGKHATIRITHGKRKKDSTGELVGYHRQDSHVTVPKAAAKSYSIGQRVHAGLSPANDNDADDNDNGAGEVNETANAAPPVKTPVGAKGGAFGGKKAAAKKTAPVKKKRLGPGRIASAMGSGF